ncbi:hypothetical protein V8D89_000913, partial [Ganoderma adspersum]
MFADPRTLPCFLTFALVWCIVHFDLVLGDPIIVDDQDRATSVRWDGPWVGFSNQPAPTWDGTLTWGNLTGAWVTFTFTGTSVQVFGAFKPVGTWSMMSQYVIDGGEPTTFVPAQEVQQEAYEQKFFDSGTLPLGEHMLNITNLGAQLWLDYFQFSTSVPEINSSSTIERPPPVTTTLASSSTSLLRSSSSMSSSSPMQSSSQIPSSSTYISSSSAITIVSGISMPLPHTAGEAGLSSSSTMLSMNMITTTSQGTETPQTHLPEITRTELVGITAGSTVGGISVLALLLWLGCWCRRRTQNRVGAGGLP